MKVDLHIHTNASSDGELPPEAIIDRCIEKNIDIIAFADHDSVGSVDAGRKYAQDKPIEIIPACEVFTHYNGKLLHMLTYGIKTENNALTKMINKANKERKDSVEPQFEAVRKAGLYCDRKTVFDFAGCDTPMASAFAYAVLSDPRNKDHKYVNGRDNSVENIIYLSRNVFAIGKDLYIEAYIPTTKEVINTAHESGGITVLAHPGADLTYEQAYIIDALISEGISGIEAYYSAHTKEQTDYYKNYAAEKGIFYTCGSDFHGDFKPNISLGCVQSDDNKGIIKNIKSAISKYK